MGGSVSKWELAWLNSAPVRMLDKISMLAFHLELRHARRAGGAPFAAASAELTAQAETILHAWQRHLLPHGEELHQLRLAGVGEAHIAALYPTATVLASVSADFTELAARPKIKRILRRASWHLLGEGSGVVPTYSPGFASEELVRYLHLPYDSPRGKPPGEMLLPFIFLSLAKPGAYPPGQQHAFNLDLRHMRYLLRVADSLTPHLSPEQGSTSGRAEHHPTPGGAR